MRPTGSIQNGTANPCKMVLLTSGSVNSARSTTFCFMVCIASVTCSLRSSSIRAWTSLRFQVHSDTQQFPQQAISIVICWRKHRRKFQMLSARHSISQARIKSQKVHDLRLKILHFIIKNR